jgi:hypothetical protein
MDSAIQKLLIESICDTVDQLALECDGCSHVVCHRLANMGIDHKMMSGQFVLKKRGDDLQVVSPHVWVETDNYIIDYRLRMWLGEHGHVPHGVISKYMANERGKLIKTEPKWRWKGHQTVSRPMIGRILDKVIPTQDEQRRMIKGLLLFAQSDHTIANGHRDVIDALESVASEKHQNVSDILTTEDVVNIEAMANLVNDVTGKMVEQYAQLWQQIVDGFRDWANAFGSAIDEIDDNLLARAIAATCQGKGD